MPGSPVSHHVFGGKQSTGKKKQLYMCICSHVCIGRGYRPGARDLGSLLFIAPNEFHFHTVAPCAVFTRPRTQDSFLMYKKDQKGGEGGGSGELHTYMRQSKKKKTKGPVALLPGD